MSYESPISIIYGDMQTKLEGDAFKAIQNCNIEVNKDELLKALAYDRNQYQKGWSDGYAQAAVDIVRCKNCIWWEKDFECWYEGSKHYHCYLLDTCTDENFYCADGREKEDADD